MERQGLAWDTRGRLELTAIPPGDFRSPDGCARIVHTSCKLRVWCTTIAGAWSMLLIMALSSCGDCWKAAAAASVMPSQVGHALASLSTPQRPMHPSLQHRRVGRSRWVAVSVQNMA